MDDGIDAMKLRNGPQSVSISNVACFPGDVRQVRVGHRQPSPALAVGQVKSDHSRTIVEQLLHHPGCDTSACAGDQKDPGIPLPLLHCR